LFRLSPSTHRAPCCFVVQPRAIIDPPFEFATCDPPTFESCRLPSASACPPASPRARTPSARSRLPNGRTPARRLSLLSRGTTNTGVRPSSRTSPSSAACRPRWCLSCRPRAAQCLRAPRCSTVRSPYSRAREPWDPQTPTDMDARRHLSRRLGPRTRSWPHNNGGGGAHSSRRALGRDQRQRPQQSQLGVSSALSLLMRPPCSLDS